MKINDYQRLAAATDQVPAGDERAFIVPLLGLASEAASLLSEYKKRLRDGPAHRLFTEQFAEELGDVLWYTANLATKFELDLEAIAAANLIKTQARFGAPDPTTWTGLFDEEFPASEQLPRQFLAELRPVVGEDGQARTQMFIDGHPVGDPLRDNARDEDGFRYHDVLHLAHAAILGWSPAFRRILKRKRKSDPDVDEIEDGGRARVIDEGIVAFVFEYARRHDWLEGVTAVDYELLRTIKNLTGGLEVRARSAAEWERAILTGYDVWRRVRHTGRGRIAVDLTARTMQLIDG